MQECIDRYGSLVWSLARRWSSDASDAEDAVQEVFISLWQSAGRFDPEIASEASFVTMIARRRLIDRGRKLARRRRVETHLEDDAPEPADQAGSAVAALSESAGAPAAVDTMPAIDEPVLAEPSTDPPDAPPEPLPVEVPPEALAGEEIPSEVPPAEEPAPEEPAVSEPKTGDAGTVEPALAETPPAQAETMEPVFAAPAPAEAAPEESTAEELAVEELAEPEQIETALAEELPEDVMPQAAAEPAPVPEETAPEEALPAETEPEVSAPEVTAAEISAPEEAVPEKATPEEAAPEQTAPEQTEPEQPAGEAATSAQSAALPTTAPEPEPEPAPGPSVAALKKARIAQALAPYQAELSSGELSYGDLARNFNEQGRGNFNRGRYEEALGDFDTAIYLQPNFAAAYHNRAKVHQAMGDATKAQEDFDKAFELGFTRLNLQ